LSNARSETIFRFFNPYSSSSERAENTEKRRSTTHNTSSSACECAIIKHKKKKENSRAREIFKNLNAEVYRKPTEEKGEQQQI
jgi:hypothetical protein